MPEIKLVYQQIREYINNEAKSKTPGEPLQSEVQYSQFFNVSRPTVRKAVNELIESGTVKRIPGKGLYVADSQHSQKAGSILFLIPYVPDDGFFYNIVMGCVDAANVSGINYKIINSSSSADRYNIISCMDLHSYSAAVLTAYDNEYDYKLLRLFKASQFPVVLVDNPLERYDLPYVITDDFKGGYLAGKHLLDNGHRKIIYITLKNNNHTVKMREAGFRKAFAEIAGHDHDERYFIRLNHDEEITDILKAIDLDYTAICGYSDLPVIRAFNLLCDKGIRIPEDISLIGYGNFSYSGMLSVPLTTISIPVYDMGYRAAEIAVGIVTNTKTAVNQMLDVKMIHRSSVASLVRAYS